MRPREAVLAELVSDFAGTFAPETVSAELDRTLALWGAPDAAAVDPLVEGYARDRLRAVAAGRDLRRKPRPVVVFVCVHNAGRSQIAAGLLRARAGGRLEVRSAGSAPAERVNPAAVEVMAELGIDLSATVPARLDLGTVRAADLVITMGCGDACPVVPGTTYLDWAVADPAGQPTERVREIRDDVARRVDELLAGLG